MSVSCAVQHPGNNKTAEQITHDKLEESKILTENLTTQHLNIGFLPI
jgi:hypothetical protein